MKCHDFDTLMMYLDGELSGNELLEVTEHIRSCPDCRRVVESQSDLESRWREDFTFPAPQEFRRREEELFRRLHRRGGWRSLVPAAAGIIAALLGVKLMIGSGPAFQSVSETARSMTEYRETGETELQERFLDHRDREGSFRDESLFPSGEDPDQQEETLEVLVTPDRSGGAADQEIPYREGIISDREETEEITASYLSQETGDAAAVGVSGRAVSDAGETASAGFPDDGLLSRGHAGQFRTPFEGAAPVCPEGGGTVNDGTVGLGIGADLDATGWDAPETAGSRVTGEMDDLEDFAGEMNTEAEEEVTLTVAGGVFFEQAPEELQCLQEESTVCLVFGEDGIPDSATCVMLDSLSPGWRDYILHDFTDTVMVVPLADVNDLLLYGGRVPAEQTE